jgi:hypothetical protein
MMCSGPDRPNPRDRPRQAGNHPDDLLGNRDELGRYGRLPCTDRHDYVHARGRKRCTLVNEDRICVALLLV